MKTQILSRRNAPISLIGFLLLVTITQIGCGVFVNRVIGSDAVRLTQDDLYMIGLTKSNRIRRHPAYPSVIAGFQQGGSSELTIQYWLFDSSSTAKKAAEAAWTWLFAASANFHPELNSEDVIGDATWHRIHSSREQWERVPTDIFFVKYNLLVTVRTGGDPSKDLQDARDIARHIEAKINAVLKK